MALSTFRHLRITFMLAWVLAWNALLGIGLFLDRQAGSSQSTYFSGMFAVAALGTSFLFLSLLYVPRTRAYALRAGATFDAIRGDLWFLVVFTSLLGLASIAGLLLGG
jgi:hypothetical protein